MRMRVKRSATEFVVTTSEGLRVAISALKTVDSAVKFNSRGMPVFYKGELVAWTVALPASTSPIDRPVPCRVSVVCSLTE